MSAFADAGSLLEGFSGRTALFPLPNVVLFPQALLPLHIFEPRYRQMTADVLAGEQFLAMALLKPGKESPPPIHDVVGLGKIIAQERLSDGRYHLVLRGVSRARLVREVPSDRMYRIGQLELLTDTIASSVDQGLVAKQLLARFEGSFPAVREHPLWREVADSRASLGMVCDLLTSALPIAPEIAQQFLADQDVESRCRALTAVLDQLQQRDASQSAADQVDMKKVFPPRFSVN